MLFIGSGALLSQAVNYVVRTGGRVDAVCCPVADSSLPRLRQTTKFIVETDNPNRDFIPLLKNCSDGVVFSINNRHLLNDRLLNSGARFFNIHNGLVQHYRGLAEVCIFAAICRGDTQYGVTLHEILPGQQVDCGPVIEQLKFEISEMDTFSTVLRRSLAACQHIFELNLEKVLSGIWQETIVESAASAYGYSNIPRLCQNANLDYLARASSFSLYAGFFPKLKIAVDSCKLPPYEQKIFISHLAL